MLSRDFICTGDFIVLNYSTVSREMLAYLKYSVILDNDQGQDFVVLTPEI